MSIEKERKLFEEFIANKYKNLIDQRVCINSDGDYMGWDMQVAWATWQASANRKGYKLVPVEATKETYLKYIEARIEAKGLNLYDMNFFNHIYKAMIGVCDAQQEKTK